MGAYDSSDMRHDLELLTGAGHEDAAERIATLIRELEVRVDVAERVCRAAVEVTTPRVKGEPFQPRQTRFLQALAEWRATQV